MRYLTLSKKEIWCVSDKHVRVGSEYGQQNFDSFLFLVHVSRSYKMFKGWRRLSHPWNVFLFPFTLDASWMRPFNKGEENYTAPKVTLKTIKSGPVSRGFPSLLDALQNHSHNPVLYPRYRFRQLPNSCVQLIRGDWVLPILLRIYLILRLVQTMCSFCKGHKKLLWRLFTTKQL